MFKNIDGLITRKKLIEKILLIFLMIQPLLDLYFLFDEKIVNMFGFSPSTIIRILFVGIIGILFIFVLKNKKEIWSYLIYIAIIFIYIICHHINALNFTNFYNGYDFGYNLIGELFYFIRMLMPLFLIIVSAHFEFDDKYIDRLITVLILLICGSIIITNLLEISTGSYSKEIIEGNIFCWFKETRCYLNYMGLASKGFFHDPNRLSALLVLITPLTYYVFIRKSNIKNMILLVLSLFGMLMLGTKVSTYGFLILSIMSLLLYLFFTFVKKEIKFNLLTGIIILSIIIINCFMLPYCPAINRTQVDREVQEEYNSDETGKLTENTEKLNELNNKVNKEEIKNENKEENNDGDKNSQEIEENKKQLMINFISQNYLDYNINPHFILNSYPYKYDPEFWVEVMGMSLESRTNFRNLERLMLERVKEKNDNKLDDYLGITFVRMGNIFDLERDFISHYYTLGIIGLIIFLIPYILIIIVCGLKMLINYKETLTLKNSFYLLGIGIALFAAFFTGNVMDGLIVTLILGVFIGQLINGSFNLGNVFENKEK